MKDVQCYELFGGIALKNHAFSFSFSCCTYGKCNSQQQNGGKIVHDTKLFDPHFHSCSLVHDTKLFDPQFHSSSLVHDTKLLDPQFHSSSLVHDTNCTESQ